MRNKSHWRKVIMNNSTQMVSNEKNIFSAILEKVPLGKHQKRKLTLGI